MDGMLTQLEQLSAQLTTVLFWASVVFVAMLVVLWVRKRRTAKHVQQFVVLDGQVLDDLPGNMRMIPKPPPHRSVPMGVSVVVHLACGQGQGRRVEDVVPIRFWRASELEGYMNLRTGAQLTDDEKQLIADEIRRRAGDEAWDQRSPQVRQVFGEADA